MDLKMPAEVENFLLTAIWMPHGQLWATIEVAASLTQC